MGRWREGQKANAVLSQKNGRRMAAGQDPAHYKDNGRSSFIGSERFQKQLAAVKAAKAGTGTPQKAGALPVSRADFLTLVERTVRDSMADFGFEQGVHYRAEYTERWNGMDMLLMDHCGGEECIVRKLKLQGFLDRYTSGCASLVDSVADAAFSILDVFSGLAFQRRDAWANAKYIVENWERVQRIRTAYKETAAPGQEMETEERE
jgi:hypothetical protein